MILFVDQSGQLGGAELCLADIAGHFQKDAKVLLFAEGPFADLLKRKDIAVSVLPLPSSLAGATKKASLPSLAANLPGLAAHVCSLKNELKKSRIGYFNTAKALLEGVPASALSRTPCLFHLHDLWDTRHFSSFNVRLLVAAANRTKAVIANSHATAQQFAAAGGRAPVHVIPNGFDPAPFDKVPPARIHALRQEFNPEDLPVAALFGRLSRWKGQEVLLRAAARLPGLCVWLVGEALFTDDDRRYATELKKRAAELGGRVHFLGFRHDVAELMHAADMIIHSSIFPEPFGRVLVEGMLARKPVIASRAGGPMEIVEDGQTGFLVEPGDDSALANAIKELMNSPSRREEMGLRGRQRAEIQYGLPGILARTEEVVASVMAKA